MKRFATVWAILCVLTSGLCGLAASQSKTYDIRHYDLRIEPDFGNKTIHIVALVHIDNPKLESQFWFALGSDYQINSLTAVSSPVTFERGDSAITVNVSQPAEKLLLQVDLTAANPKSRGEERPVIDEHSLFLLWSDRWYPADFDDWATVTTTIVVPPGFEVVAPGKMRKLAKNGRMSCHEFAATLPTVSFSVFADSRWKRTTHNVGDFRITTLLHPESQKFAARIFATSPDVLKFFSALHGGGYPFEQFAFVTVPGMYARRAFPGWVGYSPEYLEKEMARTGYDAHETSLLWWGLTSHGSGPGSWQWTEGLGDYVEAMYGEAQHKPLPQNFVRFRNDYLATPAEQDVTFENLRGNTPQKIVHGKYPWTMQVMREHIGDEAFHRGIQLLFLRYRFRTFSMDEFVATFEEASRQSLRWWREQWLERKGVPVVAFQSAVESDGSAYRVTCRLEQQAKLYDLPLQIGIKTASGTRLEKITFHDWKAEFTFSSVEEPIDVALDPNERILMKKIITPVAKD